MTKQYQSFKEFYPFYLSQHTNRACKVLHFIGSWLVIVTILFSLFSRNYSYLLLTPIFGYGFAWVGHFFFEKNRPATFTYPLYSLIGDWVMFKDLITGKISFD